jgi:phenylacetate-coenzyme A ligase PaaK-like adenylate-forming protein
VLQHQAGRSIHGHSFPIGSSISTPGTIRALSHPAKSRRLSARGMFPGTSVCGVHPDDLRHLSDLARFPTMSKKDLRDNYPFGLLAVPKDQVVRVHASSGTTGKPTVVGYTANDIDIWANVTAPTTHA